MRLNSMDEASTTAITTDLSDFSTALVSPSGADEDDENESSSDGLVSTHETLAASCTVSNIFCTDKVEITYGLFFFFCISVTTSGNSNSQWWKREC